MKKPIAYCTSLRCSKDCNSSNKSNGTIFTDLKITTTHCPVCGSYLLWKMPPKGRSKHKPEVYIEGI